MMARAVTSDELALMRTDGQFSQLYLAVVDPPPVMICQLNGIPAAFDQVTNIGWDTLSSGSPTNVQKNMTMWIGSQPDYMDRGNCRVIAVSANYITIAPTSEINWIDRSYLTIVDEIVLWPKQAHFFQGAFWCDDNQVYTNQHDITPPVPVLGPDQVLYLPASGSVSFSPTATNSWVVSGSITGYSWAASGYLAGSPVATGSAPVAISGSATVSPTFTFTYAGTYRINCTITTNISGSMTGTRVYYVYDDNNMPATQFEVENLKGDWQEGGWSFDVTMYAQAAQNTHPEVHARAKVTLFSKDYYITGSALPTSGSALGPLAGYENIIATGWIMEQSIVQNPELSTVKFTVRGPQGWLGKLGSWPAGIVNVSGSASNWNQFKQMTYDKFAWHILQYRSTATQVMDIYPSGITDQTIGATAEWGTIWDQITNVGENQFMVHPCCDRYGRLFLQRDTSLLTAAARSGVPVVMELTKQDWTGQVDLVIRDTPDTGLTDLRAMYISGSTNSSGFFIALPFRSFAPGGAIGRFGRMNIRSDLYCSGQTAANELAGIIHGEANNRYPSITFNLAAKNLFFDVAPNQYGTFSVGAADTPREIVLTNQKFIARTIQIGWNKETGTVLPVMDCEGASTIANSATAPFYQGPPVTNPPGIPGGTGGSGFNIKPIGPPSHTCSALLPANGPYNLNDAYTLFTIDYGRDIMSRNNYYYLHKDTVAHYVARGSSRANKTQLYITGTLKKSFDGGTTWVDDLDNSGWDAYLMMTTNFSGSPIVQGSKDAYSGGAYGIRTVTFNPPNETVFDAIRLTVYGSAGGLGSLQQNSLGAYCSWGAKVNAWNTTGLAWSFLDRFNNGFPYVAAAGWLVNIPNPIYNVQQYRFKVKRITGSQSEVWEAFFNGNGTANKPQLNNPGDENSATSITLAAHTLSGTYSLYAGSFWDNGGSPASHPSSYELTAFDVLAGGVWTSVFDGTASDIQFQVDGLTIWNICPWFS